MFFFLFFFFHFWWNSEFYFSEFQWDALFSIMIIFFSRRRCRRFYCAYPAFFSVIRHSFNWNILSVVIFMAFAARLLTQHTIDWQPLGTAKREKKREERNMCVLHMSRQNFVSVFLLFASFLNDSSNLQFAKCVSVSIHWILLASFFYFTMRENLRCELLKLLKFHCVEIIVKYCRLELMSKKRYFSFSIVSIYLLL